MDILITHPSYTEATKNKPNDLLNKIVQELTNSKFLTDHLSQGTLKYMGVCQLSSDDSAEPPLHRRIDLRLVPLENFWCGLLYFTGSDFFNTQMR
jgi:DNA polymerase beta